MKKKNSFVIFFSFLLYALGGKESATLSDALFSSGIGGIFSPRWCRVTFSTYCLDNDRVWLYLEPIFTSEDISRQLPVEAKKYNTMERNWRRIMKNANDCPYVKPQNWKLLSSLLLSKGIRAVHRSQMTATFLSRLYNL